MYLLNDFNNKSSKSNKPKLQTWELRIESKNHLNISNKILTTSSFELASDLLTNMSVAFKVMGYKSFRLSVVNTNNGLVIIENNG